MSSPSNSSPLREISNCAALVFDHEQQCCLQFSAPKEILTASCTDEVIPLLQAVEDAAAAGLTAVGYVAYEAAPAFDSGLITASPVTPLAQFSLFEGSQPALLARQGVSSDLSLALSIQRSSYLQKFERIHQLLESGDIYQVNFTHQLRATNPASDGDDLALFQALYQRQPSAHSVYYRSPEMTVMSVSPELFFSLQGEDIRMEPMKGTRPRGRNHSEDLALKNALLDSEKERAENLMIVDMIRNDLGRIARPGSVAVDELFKIVALPSLWQQVSSVRAQTDASLGDLFAALFPCASITGAPKRRSMEVIHEMENEARGVYTGAIGMVQPKRRMQFSVGIRTLVRNRLSGELSYGIGSGVVWDSNPQAEWQETLDKAQIVLNKSPTQFRLLETMACYPEQGVYLLAHHLERLAQSADYFGFSVNLESISKALGALKVDSPQRLRLLVSQDGEYEFQQHELPTQDGNLLLAVAATPVSSTDPFLQHKTTRREVYESAMAAAGRADDVILWNEKGELTETCIYNLYLQFGEELFTPDQSSGLLPGTYRRMMLETGRASEKILTLEDLERADAIFVSNSVRGLQQACLVTRPMHSSLESIQ